MLLNKQVGVYLLSQSEGVGNGSRFVGAHAVHHTCLSIDIIWSYRMYEINRGELEFSFLLLDSKYVRTYSCVSSFVVLIG